jgi:formiminotetrahydrofolate cyclodeaminase
MARHISAGGTPHDELGQHITEIAQECAKLKPFLNNVRRRTFEDQETQAMVESAFEYHGLLNNTLKRMSGKKGYSNCKEQFVATSTSYIPEEDLDVDAIKERFVKRVYNDKMEEALPLVYKAYDMKKNNKFAQQFESWANNVVEGWDEDEEGVKQWGIEPINIDDLADAFAEPIPLGVDGMNAISAISDIINNNELEELLSQAAAQNPEADARDVVCDWLEENVPAVYQELMNEIGDVDTPEQMECDTYGSGDGGMDGQVSEEYCDACDSAECHCDEVHEDEDEEEDNSVDAIATAIIRRILNGCGQGDQRMLALLRKLGPEGVTNAAVDIAEFAGPIHEIGSSDVSGWVAQIERDAGLGHHDLEEAFDRALGEGRVKDVDIDLKQLSDEEFKAKYSKTKEEMKAALAEGQGDDYADKSWLKKQGKQSSNEPSLKDKLLSIPKGAKAWVKGQPDDDKSLGISEMKRLAGLK